MSRNRTARTRRIVVAGALGAATVTAMTALAPNAGAAGAGRYVALGDSYSSASGVLPLTPGVDPACGQSELNYPKDVASALGLPLTDVTCGGATVSNMTQAQYPDQPAQFNALGPDVTTVTLGIGGNDNEAFASAIAACGSAGLADPLQIGSPCHDLYGNYFNNLIDSDAANIGSALQRIHQLAPNAKIFVVGYGEIMPHTTGCYPTIPVVSGDIPYVDGIERHLNAMLATEAAANNATFVDVYANSSRHDACKPAGTRWIEPPISAQPVHPNALGEANTAQLVEAAIAK